MVSKYFYIIYYNMDSFKIIVIIFMIIIIIKVFILDNNYKEHFEQAEQSVGGVDDQNAINTLAQLARKLMDGGATVPGNLNFKGTTMPLSILSGVASPDAYKFQFGDGSGWRLRFQKDDTSPTMDVYDNGNVNVAGNMKANTITSDGAIKIKNKWMIGGSGGGSGDDEWVRMTGLDNKGYYGGFAAGKLYTADNTINGRNIFAELDDIKANMVRYGGIVRHRRVPDNRWVRGDNTSDWDSSYSDWRILRQ